MKTFKKEIESEFCQLINLAKNGHTLQLPVNINYDQLTNILINHDIICPMENQWLDLWIDMKNYHLKEQSVSMPYILDAWHFSSDQDKRDRFFEQLELAEQYKKLDKIIEFLNKLDIKDFYFEVIVVL